MSPTGRLSFALLGGLAGCPASSGPRELAERAEPANVEAVARSSEPRASSTAASSAAAAIASEPALAKPASSAPPPVPPGPAVVETVPIAGDRDASVVRAADGASPRAVFLPGVCSNANAYLYGFAEAARANGGVVGVEGDRPCAYAAGFQTFSHDLDKLDARIQTALAAAGGDAAATAEVTLFGYSLGATLAEELAHAHPERYVRVVLIGSPKDPRVALLTRARAVATMSCQLDVPPRMKGGAQRLEAAGVPARYFEMPGCTHGLIAEGDRVFGDVFHWLAAAPEAGAGSARP